MCGSLDSPVSDLGATISVFDKASGQHSSTSNVVVFGKPYTTTSVC